MRLEIKTGSDLREARRLLGWSVIELADALRLSGDRGTVSKRVREMESGQREISGPICALVEKLLDERRANAR